MHPYFFVIPANYDPAKKYPVRFYNVDENRASLLGISDGATGIYYHAMLAATPWSAMLPFNGQPAVLANVASPNGATLFAGNASTTPFYIVHGALDRLYPLSSVMPWWTLFEAAGLRPVKHVKDPSNTSRISLATTPDGGPRKRR